MKPIKIKVIHCNNKKIVSLNCNHSEIDVIQCNHSCHLGLPIGESQCLNCDKFDSTLNVQKMAERISTFAQTMTSLVFEDAPTHSVQLARLAICKECPALDSTKAEEGMIGHCSECGCAVMKATALENKAAMPHNSCPRKLWDLPSVAT